MQQVRVTYSAYSVNLGLWTLYNLGSLLLNPTVTQASISPDDNRNYDKNSMSDGNALVLNSFRFHATAKQQLCICKLRALHRRNLNK